MYISRLSVQKLKLLRQTTVSFLNEDGTPRMWTVFVGENGLGKTSLLQAIAMAASGPTRANQLASVASLRDKRERRSAVRIEARFTFSERFQADREYPGIVKPSSPPLLDSTLELPVQYAQLIGESAWLDPVSSQELPKNPGERLDPLSDARARNLPLWFVVGYGVGRNLPMPQSSPHVKLDPAQDRLRSLFDPTFSPASTEFIERFRAKEARTYAKRLRQAFIDSGILPGINAIDLRGRGGVQKPSDLVESHRFEQVFSKGKVKVPAVWLSHGYQSTISWIADLIGQIFLEAENTNLELEDMEGIVLIDEIDLHLHPRWQRTLVETLRKAFPALQFIATTHSPMVLAGLKREEIFLMEQDDEGSVTAVQASQSARLMTGSEIYQSFFHIDHVYPNDVGERLREYGYLAGNPFRTDEEEIQLHRLLAELRGDGIEPEWEPAPRRSPPAPGGEP